MGASLTTCRDCHSESFSPELGFCPRCRHKALKALERALYRYPELRLGQLISTAAKSKDTKEAIFYLTDHKLALLLEEF